MANSVTSLDSSVYYKEQYWDAFPQAKTYIQRQVSGDPKQDSLKHFRDHYAQKPFKHGLFLNCGNGWLERWFIRHGLVKMVTAFDCSQTLINQAKKNAKGLPITYLVADANTIELPKNTYDLVVNSAALHHVQYMNRLCTQIARSMKKNGIFFHYDYIGPHRNQYTNQQWDLVKKVNSTLPKTVRKDPLPYPHLPTMMVSDPSEAIHSELILQTLSRYFDVKERHDISGMIAYNLLSLNPKLHKGQKSDAIQTILKEDALAYGKGQIPPLFTYMITTPKKNMSENDIRHWQLEENFRERDAKIIEHTYSIREYWKLMRHSKAKIRSLRLALYCFARINSYLVLA